MRNLLHRNEVRIVLALLPALGVLSVGAHAQTAPADPTLQTFIGSTQLLLKSYGEQTQELVALRAQNAQLMRQVDDWKKYAAPMYEKAAPAPAVPQKPATKP